jgi:starch synthase
MNILMVASEATPFAKTGGLADVLGGLPPALQALGENVAVVMPAYRENRYPHLPREAYRNLWIPLGPGYLADVHQAVERDVTYYFVNCPPLYDRNGIYGDGPADFPDNHMRFAVLSMAAIGVARYLFRPDIIHTHDWQASLVPVYIREHFHTDPSFLGVKQLFTIHNLGYQGLFPPEVLPEIALDGRLFNLDQLEFFGKVNFLKGGIAWSDAVSTVSKGYAQEIQTKELGFGLDTFLRKHGPITGILNGVDYSQWNPETDKHLERNYSSGDLSGKRECKRALLAEFGLPAGSLDRPIIGMVSRLTDQKGFDLIADVASALIAEDIILIVLGSGNPKYEKMLRLLGEFHRDKVAALIGYDEALAHRIVAAADMFLVPSRYEPSGLTQMYSLRYGTVPVVRATGGLDEAIDEQTGFKFRDYSGVALLRTVQVALAAYRDQSRWTAMMRRGMQRDFSWNASAARYLALYKHILES